MAPLISASHSQANARASRHGDSQYEDIIFSLPNLGTGQQRGTFAIAVPTTLGNVLHVQGALGSNISLVNTTYTGQRIQSLEQASPDQCTLWNDSCSGNRTVALDTYPNSTGRRLLLGDQCFIDPTSTQCFQNKTQNLTEISRIKDWMRSPACLKNGLEWDTAYHQFSKTLTNDSNCCGTCYLSGQSVDVYYWPVSGAETWCLDVIGNTVNPVRQGATTDGNETYFGCTVKTPLWGKTYIRTAHMTSIGTLTYKVPLRDPHSPVGCVSRVWEKRDIIVNTQPRLKSNVFSITRGSTVPVTTVVLHGFTFTSPSIYANFFQIGAGDRCGATTIEQTMMTFSPGELSTIAGPLYSGLSPGHPHIPWSTKRFDFKDLPCPDYSVRKNNWYVPWRGEPYRPLVAVPEKVRAINPFFSSCTDLFFDSVDPPTALLRVEGLVNDPEGTEDVASLYNPSPKTTAKALVPSTGVDPPNWPAPGASPSAGPINTAVFAQQVSTPLPTVSLQSPNEVDNGDVESSHGTGPDGPASLLPSSPVIPNFTENHAAAPDRQVPSMDGLGNKQNPSFTNRGPVEMLEGEPPPRDESSSVPKIHPGVELEISTQSEGQERPDQDQPELQGFSPPDTALPTTMPGEIPPDQDRSGPAGEHQSIGVGVQQVYHSQVQEINLVTDGNSGTGSATEGTAKYFPATADLDSQSSQIDADDMSPDTAPLFRAGSNYVSIGPSGVKVNDVTIPPNSLPVNVPGGSNILFYQHEKKLVFGDQIYNLQRQPLAAESPSNLAFSLSITQLSNGLVATILPSENGEISFQGTVISPGGPPATLGNSFAAGRPTPTVISLDSSYNLIFDPTVYSLPTVTPSALTTSVLSAPYTTDIFGKVPMVVLEGGQGISIAQTTLFASGALLAPESERNILYTAFGIRISLLGTITLAIDGTSTITLNDLAPATVTGSFTQREGSSAARVTSGSPSLNTHRSSQTKEHKTTTASHAGILSVPVLDGHDVTTISDSVVSSKSYKHSKSGAAGQLDRFSFTLALASLVGASAYFIGVFPHFQT